jgi:hypothetical protein
MSDVKAARSVSRLSQHLSPVNNLFDLTDAMTTLNLEHDNMTDWF